MVRSPYRVIVLCRRDSDADFTTLRRYIAPLERSGWLEVERCSPVQDALGEGEPQSQRDIQGRAAELIVTFEDDQSHPDPSFQKTIDQLTKRPGSRVIRLVSPARFDAPATQPSTDVLCLAPWRCREATAIDAAWYWVAKRIETEATRRPVRMDSRRSRAVLMGAGMGLALLLAIVALWPSARLPNYDLVIPNQSDFLAPPTAGSRLSENAGLVRPTQASAAPVGPVTICPGDLIDIKLVPEFAHREPVKATVSRHHAEGWQALDLDFYHSTHSGTLLLRGSDIFAVSEGEGLRLRIELTTQSWFGLSVTRQQFILSIARRPSCPSSPR